MSGSTKTPLKSKFETFSGETTLHGFRNAFSTKYKTGHRLVWMLILLIMISAYMYVFTTSLVRYFKYNVSTSNRQIYADTLEYPTLSVCDQNMFTNSALHEYPGLYEAVTYHGMLSPTELNYSSIAEDESNSVLRSVELAPVIMKQTEQFQQKFFDCKFNNIPFECESIVQFRMTGSSVCYSFNLHSLGSLPTEPGYIYGFRKYLILDQIGQTVI